MALERPVTAGTVIHLRQVNVRVQSIAGQRVLETTVGNWPGPNFPGTSVSDWSETLTWPWPIIG